MSVRPLRVYHIYKTYFPDTTGGLEKVIEHICLQTKELGVENSIVTLSRNPHPFLLERKEAKVYRFPILFDLASSPFSLKLLREYSKLIEDADILHYHFPWPFGDFLHLFAGKKKKTVVTYHSDILRQKYLKKIYAPIMKRFLKSADRIVATSPNYIQSSSDLKLYRDKILSIPICLDEKTYPVANGQKLQYWQDTVGNDFFLFVGVLRYYKGLHVLFEAVKGSQHNVVIVGQGPLKKELKKLANDYRLEKNIHFVGFLPEEDKAALMKLCKAVVFPSHLRTEAFGVTLVEGAMAGKPLISMEIGTGTSFVNKSEVTGFVVPPHNPKALRKAMDEMADNDDLVEKMGRAARERFEKVFSAPRMGEAYNSLYKEVLRR